MRVSLAAMRVNSDISQKDAARELGIDPSTLRSWEKGQTVPDYEQLVAMCKLYRCTFDDINLPKKSA